MQASEYQNLSSRTLLDKPDHKLTDEETMILWASFGLAGEIGEVLDMIKKGVFHRHGLDRDKIAEELGDILWYVAAIATKLNIDMDKILIDNVDKLRARYPNGFSSSDSMNRSELWDS